MTVPPPAALAAESRVSQHCIEVLEEDGKGLLKILSPRGTVSDTARTVRHRHTHSVIEGRVTVSVGRRIVDPEFRVAMRDMSRRSQRAVLQLVRSRVLKAAVVFSAATTTMLQSILCSSCDSSVTVLHAI